MPESFAPRVFATGSIMLFSIAGALLARADEWKQYANIEQVGWSAEQLDKARGYAAKIRTAALLIVDHGHVVAAWGAIDHPFKSASMRKSVYDATLGATHLAKPFDVNTEIAKLNIDDLQPLSDVEKSATLEQLLTARSGIYHPAAYETRSNANRRPPRGSAKPGTRWYYNNWDFNVVCVAFERLTGQTMLNAFTERLAKPLGLQDFKTSHVFQWLEPRLSRYPAVTFRLSARDLARIGMLYLQNGKWEGKQIVAEEWVKQSTRPHTIFEPGHYRGEGTGYGRLWWVFPARPERNEPYEAHRRIAARGAGGQIMVLIPDLQLLIVHLADTDGGRGVGDRQGIQLLNMIVGARTGDPTADAKLTRLHVEKLGDRSPTPLNDDLNPVSKKRRLSLEGYYAVDDNSGMRLYQFEDRLFAQPVGVPLNDAELFLAADGSLRSPDASFVFEPIPAAEASVESLRVTIRGRTRTAQRADPPASSSDDNP